MMRFQLIFIVLITLVTSQPWIQRFTFQDLKLEEREGPRRYDTDRILFSCSGYNFNEMSCSCLTSAYKFQLNCSADTKYNSICATYNHHCITKSSGKKRESMCCKAVLCYLDKLGCN
ncbi:hypothetical protein ACHWQZ_G014585 [Mnemiopsis leidyi]